MLEAGVYPVPDFLIAPVAIRRRFEQDRQCRGVVDFTKRDLACVGILVVRDVFLPAPGSRGDHVQGAGSFEQPGLERFP